MNTRRLRVGILRLPRPGVALALSLVVACSGEARITDPDVLGTVVGQVSALGGGGLPNVGVRLTGVYSDSTFTDGSGNYAFERVAGGSYSVAITGYPSGISFTPSQKPATISTAGETVTVDFEGTYPAVQILTSSLGSGQVGTAYSDSVRATGGPGGYTWSVVSGTLPPGLNLSSSTGNITGTPTTAGTSMFTVQAATPAGSPTRPLSISVFAAGLQITTTQLPNGALLTPYSATLQAVGATGAITWAVVSGALPAGITLAAASGQLSGTPTTAGTSNFSVRAATASDTATATLSIFVPAGAGPIHRWRFEEVGGSGTILSDDIGGSNGTIVEVGANNATAADGAVTLTGGARASSDYLALPGGRLSGLTDATIELWATPLGVRPWGRVFDVGSGTTNYLMMAWTNGTDPLKDRLQWVSTVTSGTLDDLVGPYTLGTQYHIAVTIDDDGGTGGSTLVRAYRDGVLRGSFSTALNLGNISDTNFWLGRSQFGVDDVAQASYNEFRIYDRALSAAEIQANTANPPPPSGPRVVSWTNAAGGLWSTGSNWSSGTTPTSTDDVQITLSGTYTVTLDVSPAIKSLTLGAATGAQTLAFAGFDVTATGNVTVSATGILEMASTLTTTGAVANAGVITLSGSTISAPLTNSGTLNVRGASAINGALSTSSTSMIRVSSSGGADATLNVSSAFTNNGVITLTNDDATARAVALNLVSGSLTNGPTGAINVTAGSGGGTRSIGASLDNRGAVSAQHPVAITGALIVPTGAMATLSGNGSTLSVVGLNVDGLTIDNVPVSSTGGTLSRFDNATFQNMDPVAQQLTVSHPGAATPFTFDRLTFLTTPTSGAYLNATDNLADANTLTIGLSNSTPADGSAATITGSGAVVNWGAPGPGTVAWANPAGGSWSVASNWSTGAVPTTASVVAITLDGTYTVTVDANVTVGSLTIGGGGLGFRSLDAISRTITVSGRVVVQSRGSVQLSASTLNAAVVDLTGGSDVWAEGSSVVADTVKTSSGTNFTLVNGSSVVGQFVNGVGGTLIVGPGSNTLSAGPQQAGTVSIRATTGNATLTVPQSFTSSGVYEFIGSSFTARHTQSSGTFTNSGTVRVVDGSHAMSAQFTNTGTLLLEGGNLTLTPTTTFTTSNGTIDVRAGQILSVAGGTIAAGSSTTMLGTGAIDLTGTATLSLPSDFTLPPGGPAWAFGGTVTVNGAGTLINQAMLTLSADVMNVPFTNASTGTLIVSPGTSALNAALTQLGTLRVRGGTAPAALTVAAGFTNAGVIELTNDVANAQATLTVTTGTLVNATTGSISGLAGAGGGARTLAATLDHRGSLTVNRPLTITGQLVVPAGSASVTGNGSTLSVAGLNVDGLTVDNVPLISTGGTLTRFDNVSFQNLNPVATQLTVTHPGAATPLTFAGVQFLVTPTTGRYVVATDSGTPTTVLRINFTNSMPADGFAFTTVAGGAVVNWMGSAGAGVAWINSEGGNWSDATNWSGGSLPAASDSVEIALSGNYTVTMDVDVTVARLRVGGNSGTRTLAATGRTFSVTQGGEVLAGGVLALTTSTLNGAAPLVNVVGGVVQLTGSTVNVAVQNAGNMRVLYGTGSMLNGALTTVAGSTVEVEPYTNATLTVAAGFTNNGTISLLAGTPACCAQRAMLEITNGTLTNALGGSITAMTAAGGGGPAAINAALDNQGTITLSGALTLNAGAGAVTNSGTVTGTGSLSVTAGSITNSGSWTSGQLTVSGAAAFSNTGSLSVNGGTVTLTGSGAGMTTSGSLDMGATKLTVAGGPFAWTAGTITGADTLHLSGLTATFTPSLNLGVSGPIGLQLTNATLSGAGQLNTGTGALVLSGSTVNVAVQNAGNMRVLYGTGSMLNGALTTVAGSTVEVEPYTNATLTVAAGFTNNGTISLLAGTPACCAQRAMLEITNGTLTNALGGSITAMTAAGGGGPAAINAALDNQGTITLSGALTLNAGAGAVTNSGTVTGTGSLSVTAGSITNSGSLTSGALTVTGANSFANTGTLSVNGGSVTMTGTGAGFTTAGSVAIGTSKLTVTNGPFAYTAGTITGPDTLALSNLTATFTPDLNVGGTGPSALQLTNSTLNGGGQTVASGGILQLTGSTINAALDNRGMLRVLSGSGTLNGVLTTVSTSTIEVSPQLGHATLTVAAGFTNSGAINLIPNQNGAGYSLALTVSSGTLLNASGASISHDPASGFGAGAINASLNNQGTVTINRALTINGPLTQRGAVTVNAALTVTGQLIVPNTATGTFTGNGSLLTVAGLNVDGALFDNVRLTSTGGALVDFDNVTFQNMSVTATQFTLSHPGAATPFGFDNVDFLTTPTTGFYIQANDTAADGNVLTLNLTNQTPANGSARTSTTGGAVVNWL